MGLSIIALRGTMTIRLRLLANSAETLYGDDLDVELTGLRDLRLIRDIDLYDSDDIRSIEYRLSRIDAIDCRIDLALRDSSDDRVIGLLGRGTAIEDLAIEALYDSDRAALARRLLYLVRVAFDLYRYLLGIDGADADRDTGFLSVFG